MIGCSTDLGDINTYCSPSIVINVASNVKQVFFRKQWVDEIQNLSDYYLW